MLFIIKLGKILSFKYIPVTVKQGLLFSLGQGHKSISVASVASHKKAVVGEQGRDKYSFHTVLTRKALARGRWINEPCLYPAVTDATRICGGFYLLWEGVCSSDSGNKIDVLALGKVSQLVKADKVVFCTLILVNVVFGRAVAEVDYRAVFKPARVGRGVK